MADLVLEDGSGMPTANSYASVEECDEYHVAHLYATAWTNATDPQKEAALQMATRVLDVSVEWNGQRKTEDQALGWPRDYAPEPGSKTSVMTLASLSPSTSWSYYPNDEIPKGLKDATCEMARELLKGDRTDFDSQKKGVESIGLGQGAISVKLNAADRKRLITDTLALMLRPFGRLLTATESMVPVERR